MKKKGLVVIARLCAGPIGRIIIGIRLTPAITRYAAN